MNVYLWKYSNNHPNSASLNDAMKFVIMMHYTCTGLLSRGITCIGVLDFGPSKKYPPALLCASGYDI